MLVLCRPFCRAECSGNCACPEEGLLHKEHLTTVVHVRKVLKVLIAVMGSWADVERDNGASQQSLSVLLNDPATT
jgi:hypothetical protein